MKQGPTQQHRHLGIAVDEALLVTFMLGSVGSFGAVVVPWEDLSLGNSPQAQAVHILSELETANNTYKKLYNAWPHEMTNGDENHNVVVLMSRQALRYPYSTMTEFKSVLPTLKTDLSSNGIIVKHDLSDGRILQSKADIGTGYAIEITLENIPLDMAQHINKKFDGDDDKKGNRVSIIRSGQLANVIFKSNKL